MIVVTGATGTVGSQVVHQLVALGERPRVLVRNLAASVALFGDNAEHVAVDLDQDATLAHAFDGAERAFIVTRQSSRQPDQERSAVQHAVRAGVAQLVKVSVFAADDQSPLRIARQHRELERVVQESRIAATILRPTYFMQNLLRAVKAGELRTGVGPGRVSMVDARDVAAAAVAALTAPVGRSATYTLTGPQALTFDEVADVLSTTVGSPVRHRPAGPGGIRTAAVGGGYEAWFGDDMARLHALLADGYEDIVTDGVVAATGTAPRTLDEFARDFAKSLRNAAAA
jgi:uncharacterized protein YbjT (DUF2867 family)